MKTKEDISLLVSSENKYAPCMYEQVRIEFGSFAIDVNHIIEKDETYKVHVNAWQHDNRTKDKCKALSIYKVV